MARCRYALDDHGVRVVDIDEWWQMVDSGTGRFSWSGSVPSADGGRALHRELLGGRNTTRKLMRREIGQLRGRQPPPPDVNFCTEKFRRFKLQEEFFVRNVMEQSLWTTSSTTGIIVANDFIFVVASPGICMAFWQTKNGSIAPYRRDGQIWYFNNVFYNKINDSIIIVSWTIRHGRNGYKTRALPLESIRRCNHLDNGDKIFRGRSMCMPVFYDHNNIAVIPQSTSVVNVHEMNNYNLVHSFRSKNILFVTSRPCILIIAYVLIETYLSIEVLSTENWTVLKKLNYAVPPNGFQLISICQDNILLQGGHTRTIHMFDIWNDNRLSLIRQTDDKHHNLLAANDLTAYRLLLRFNKNIIVIASCNSHDKPLALLEDNEVPGNSDNGYFGSDTYVTRDKNYAMIYSRKHIKKPRQGINRRQGSIKIYNTINGKSIWKINPCDDVDLAIATRKEGDNNMTNIHSTIHEALEDVTTLFYDEERHKIYTGNRQGFLHVWSN